MTPVLLDTGCIVALLDRSERHHRQCVEVVSAQRGPLVTCEAVIAEACHVVRTLPGASEAILQNVEEGIFQVPFRIDRNAAVIRSLLKRYKTVPMDLADACLVVLADQLSTGRILTLDRDFEVYRWRRNHRFELLNDL